MSAPSDLLRAIFDSMSEGVVYQDADGRICQWNASAERILGLTADRLTGRTSYDPRWCAIREDGSPFPGEEHPSMVTIRTGHAVAGVLMGIRKPDGTLTWLSISSRPVWLEGPRAGALTTFIDVTEREQITRLLPERRAFDALLIRMLTRFVGAGPDELDRILTDALGDVARFLGADHAHLATFAVGYNRLDLVYEWSDPDVAPEAHRLRAANLETRPWLRDEMLAGRVVRLDPSHPYPSDSPEARAGLPAVGTRLMVPLTLRGQVIGGVSIHAHRHPRPWTDDDVTRVTLVGNAMATVLDRRAVLQDLERRRAFDEQVSALLVRLTVCSDADVQQEVERALAELAAFISADHAFVLSVLEAHVTIPYEWAKEEVPRLAGLIGRFPLTSRPWQARQLQALQPVVIDSLDDFPPEAAEERALLEREGARSLLMTPTTGQDGTVTGAVGFHRHDTPGPWNAQDVTSIRMAANAIVTVLERRRVEAERLRSEARYRLLAEGVADDIWQYDLEAERFTYVSPAVRRQRGLTPEDVMAGNGLDSMLAPEEAPVVAASFRQRAEAVRGGDQSARTATYLTAVLHQNGTRIPVEISTRLVDGPGGRVRFVHGVTRDISERIALQAQLQQAQKMDAVGRLAGGVAHDFNNLLTVIVGNAELAAAMLPRDSEPRRDIEEVIGAARRAAGLTSQLLAFARQQPSRASLVDLNSTLEGMVKLLRRLIGEHITLVWRPDAAAWPALGDPVQVDQIVANLAVNARDAMGGAGVLTISTSNSVVRADTAALRDLTPGDYVRLTVSDTGAGMSNEVRQRAFEPFFTTKEIGKGTGLGLSTVYGIARQHGGSVEIESTPGVGTTVHVYFPRASGSSVAPAVGAAERIARGTETILLVEDKDQLRHLADRALTALGYTVLTAESAAMALDLVARHTGPLHLLLTDVVMPGMNGPQLRGAIEALRPGMPTLFMSGHTTEVLQQSGISMDATMPFLQKPFTLEGLASAVRRVLDAPTAAAPDAKV